MNSLNRNHEKILTVVRQFLYSKIQIIAENNKKI